MKANLYYQPSYKQTSKLTLTKQNIVVECTECSNIQA